MKNLSEKFTDDEFAQLQAVKDGRSWREAILEEFGVADQ